MKKKILSMAAILLFLIAILPNTNVTKAATSPITTTVNIYKLQADKYNSPTGIENKDGDPIIDTNSLGNNVKPLPGVVFTASEISETTYYEYVKTIPTTLDNTKVINSNTLILPATDQNGLTKWDVTLSPGQDGKIAPKYFVVYETGKPSNVSSSIAVPFIIAFPMTKSDGSGYLNNINIYPKNITGPIPVPGMDISKLNNNTSSYNVGEVVLLILKGTIPSNIADYRIYSFKTTLNAALLATGINNTSTEIKAGDTILTGGTDYNVTVNGQDVSIELTPEGILKISKVANIGLVKDADIDTAENITTAPILQATITSILSSNAPLATEVSTTTTLMYDNNKIYGTNDSNDVVTTLPSNSVTVVTGGKTFKKVDEKSNALAEAQFTLLEDGNAINWTSELIKANQEAITAGKFINATDGNQIIFKSVNDGTFEIKGLAYSAMGKDGVTPSTYLLNEIKAPAGYQILTGTIDLTIDSNSYNTLSPMNVVNKLRPTIPATGGIGALIFIVFGVGLVSYAYYGYKKEKAKN